jgi:hypothetical protein
MRLQSDLLAAIRVDEPPRRSGRVKALRPSKTTTRRALELRGRLEDPKEQKNWPQHRVNTVVTHEPAAIARTIQSKSKPSMLINFTSKPT